MTPNPPSPKPRCGSQLAGGRYELVRELGGGGSGVVWVALHRAMNVEVVVKFPSKWDSADISHRQLQSEAISLAAFSNRHPHIMNILDVGVMHARPFVVMQHLQRGSLGDHCHGAARRTTTYAQLRSSPTWLLAVADALDFIHREKLIHRDVKPANVLLDDSLSAYLADFGLAAPIQNSAGASSGIWGSLPYMAPELLGGKTASPASDQFALAATFFEFLMGVPPFSGGTATEILAAQELAALPPWHIADGQPDWTEVLRRALHIDATKRYATCCEFVAKLARCWPPHLPDDLRSGNPHQSDTDRNSAATAVTDSTDRDRCTPIPSHATPVTPSIAPPVRKIKLRQVLDGRDDGQ